LSYTLITTEQELSKACKALSSENFLAIDTEFKRETSYFPIPCLLQICATSGTICIDLIAIKNLSALEDILFNENILKVFHAARQDLELFYCMFDRVPSPIYDTQIGASFLGSDNQIGYANLVNQELDITLDKSQTRTDWTKRPFTQKQLDYAANDVIFLRQLYIKQLKKLNDISRLPWCEQEFLRLIDTRLYKPDPESAWTRVKNYQRLGASQKCIVYKLAEWREVIAIEGNHTRNIILKNSALLDIAYNAPTDLQTLKNTKDLSYRIFTSHGEEILSIIKLALQMDVNQCPHPKEYSKLTDEQSALLKKIIQSIESKSQSSNISSAVLCSRKELEKIVRGKRDSALFEDWRYELAGEEILKQLPS